MGTRSSGATIMAAGDIRRYGARRDEPGFDNAAAIAAAWADRAQIVMPEGTFYTSTSSVFGPNGDRGYELICEGGPGACKLHDLRNGAVTTLAFRGTSVSDRADHVRIHGLQITGADGFTNDRTALELKYVAKYLMADVSVWSTKRARYLHHATDGQWERTHIDQCGKTADPTSPVSLIEADNADNADCDSTEFNRERVEQCRALLMRIVGTAKRNNKLYWTGGKFEVANNLTANFVEIDTADHIEFLFTHWSVGSQLGGWVTPIDVLTATNVHHLVVAWNHFQCQALGAPATTVRDFIRLNDANSNARIVGNAAEVALNSTQSGAMIRFIGTQLLAYDHGNEFDPASAGTPGALRIGAPTSVSA